MGRASGRGTGAGHRARAAVRTTRGGAGARAAGAGRGEVRPQGGEARVLRPGPGKTARRAPEGGACGAAGSAAAAVGLTGNEAASRGFLRRSPLPKWSAAGPAAKTKAAVSNPQDSAWVWPARGTLLHGFNEGPNPKGVAIGGELGQAIVASADGKVVYSGSGLRGYGKLVIIKHDSTYLSVYAHNRTLLVKEGERVTKGQKIAEMGNTDAGRVALHFEIRRLGKPVDPLQYLPGQGAS